MNAVSFRPIVFAAAVYAAAVVAGLQSVRAAGAPSAADTALFDRLDADHDGQIVASDVSQEHGRLFARLLRQGDTNGDTSLSRDEFIAGLVPSRPEKPIEEKQPASFPQAEAVRWLLLTIDTSGNSSIEKKEVPDNLLRIFDAMTKRIDGNKDGVLDRRELTQGGRPLAQIAGRYVQTEGIDTAAELKKLEKKLGPAVRRFDAPPPRFDSLGDPEQARQLFARLDGNGNGQVEKSEMAGRQERTFQRLVRLADRDGDGQLSEREFLAGARQIARRQARPSGRPMRTPDAMPADAKPAEKAMPAEDSMPADGQ